MYVGFVRIQRTVARRNGIAVTADCNRRHHAQAADEITVEIRIEAQTRERACRKIIVGVERVLFLMSPPELGLENESRAESMNPACSVVLTRIVGDTGYHARKSAGTRGVVINGTVAEPEEVFAADILIDSGGEFILVLPEWRIVDRVVVRYSGVEQRGPDGLCKANQAIVNSARRNLVTGKWVADKTPGVIGIRPCRRRIVCLNLPGKVPGEFFVGRQMQERVCCPRILETFPRDRKS